MFLNCGHFSASASSYKKGSYKYDEWTNQPFISPCVSSLSDHAYKQPFCLNFHAVVYRPMIIPAVIRPGADCNVNGDQKYQHKTKQFSGHFCKIKMVKLLWDKGVRVQKLFCFDAYCFYSTGTIFFDFEKHIHCIFTFCFICKCQEIF